MTRAATVIACLTPPGKGAIAVLGVRGPAAWTATRALFQRFTARKKTQAATAPLPEGPAPGRIWLGLLGERSRDEAVLLVRETAPAPWLEVHCHGGVEVVLLIEELYRGRGVQVVPWSEFAAEHTPAWQVEALRVLAQAPTTRTAAIALDQWHGAFVRQVERIEVASAGGKHAEARAMLERLVQLVPVGRHLAKPWKVVVAGAPNVGKSSLINALAGFARCVVSPIPGTTRDVVTTAIALDGWPVELCDTAGIRTGAETLEQAGIARAQAALAEADLRVWVVDGAAPPVHPERGAGEWLLVINKCDLPATWSAAPEALRVSALTGAGVKELCDAIARRLVPVPPTPGEAVPISGVDEQMLAALGEGLS